MTLGLVAAAPASAQLLPYKADGPTAFTVFCDRPWQRDAQGIPMVNYPDPATWVYNPGTIAMCGLHEYSWWRSSREQPHLDYARRIGDWFLRNQKASGAWTYPFAFPLGGTSETLKPGWQSGYAQGLAMSLLTRVYRATKDRRYLAAAKRAAKPLTKTVKQGGVQAKLFGRPFYEEYPSQKPTYALAGFMISLVGLYDLRQTVWESGDRTSKDARTIAKLYSQGVGTLAFALPFYDTGSSSLYWLAHLNHRGQAFMHRDYHPTHIVCLQMLESVTKNRTIGFYATLWASYKQPA